MSNGEPLASSSSHKEKSSLSTKPRRVQEKIMGIIFLFFAGGVLMFTILPEGAVRGVAMGLFSTGMIYYVTKIK